MSQTDKPETLTRPTQTGGAKDAAVPRQFAPMGAAPAMGAHGVVPFILRLTLGLVILPHGLQKVFGLFGGPGFANTLDYFAAQWQIPSYLTVAVMAAEFLGSLGLVFGVLTRLSALGILAVMFGAISLEHWEYGFFMNWGGSKAGEGFEYHLLAVGIAISILFTGPGRWSIDHWRRNRSSKRS